MVPLYPCMQLSIVGLPTAENTSSWKGMRKGRGERGKGGEGGGERCDVACT